MFSARGHLESSEELYLYGHTNILPINGDPHTPLLMGYPPKLDTNSM